MGVRVVTDSACDLPVSLAEQLGIIVVPLTIRFGDEEFVDREELTNAEFWRRLSQSSVLPETAAPSAGRFEQAFRTCVDEGADGIVCINLSSKMSGTIQAAQIGAKAVEGECPIEVIDSLSASMGVGNMAVAAAELAAGGADVDTITADVESRRARTKLYGALDTLEFLRKGGRVGQAQALLGSMLSIKPVVEVREGEVHEASKVRTRSKALRALVDKVKEQPVERVAVLHGQAPDIDEFLAVLAPLVDERDVLVGEVGPVIGTHAGPSVIGVTFEVPQS